MDLTPTFGPGGGVLVQKALDKVGLTLNKNTVPGEPASPFFPSGVRLGTAAATTRGMKEKEMRFIANIMLQVIEEIKSYRLPLEKEKRGEYSKEFSKRIEKNKKLKELHTKVKRFAVGYRIP